MKNVCLLFIITILFSCNGSHKSGSGRVAGPHHATDKALQAKAEEAVKANLLSDTARHYAPISFGTLDSLYQSFAETAEGISMDSLAEYYSGKQMDNMGDAAKAEEFGKKKLAAQIAVQDKMAAYEGPWIGWIISHKFKTNDIAGVPTTDERLYRLNKDFTVKGIVEDPLREIGN